MNKPTLYKILSYFIALIWFINGAFCKVLNLVPRHQEIVSRILGTEHAGLLTKAIGFAEILMAAWVVSDIKTRLAAIVQIIIIAAMNLLETALVPDLLLWGRMNLFFAFVLIGLIYYNEFHLNNKKV